MAFTLNRLDDALHTPDVRAKIAPASRAFVSLDPRFARMTPFLPWNDVVMAGGVSAHIIGHDHIASLFFDELIIDETAVPEVPPVPLILTSVEGSAVSTPLAAVVAAGMAVIAYDNRRDFLCIYRQHLATLDPMPTVQAVEIAHCFFSSC